MRVARLLIGVLVVDLGLIDIAAAQQPSGGDGSGQGRGAVMRACSDDIQKFCPDAKGPARRQCLHDNQDKLSDGCKSAIANMREHNRGN